MSLGCPLVKGNFTYPSRGHCGRVDKSIKSSISSSTEQILGVEESHPDSSLEMKLAAGALGDRWRPKKLDMREALQCSLGLDA